MFDMLIAFLGSNKVMLSFFLSIFLYVTLLFTVIFLFLNFKTLKNEFKNIKKRTWVILFMIFLSSLFLRIYSPKLFITYFDEFAQMDVAKNIMYDKKSQICMYTDYETKTCTLYDEPAVLPFVFAIFFSIFGIGEQITYAINILIGSLLTVLMFLFAYVISKKEGLALCAALVITLSPLYILQSHALENNIISTFFILLGLTTLLIYFRVKTLKMAMLAIFFLAFFIQARFDNSIAIIPIFIFFAYQIKNHIKSYKFWLPWITLAVLVIPFLFLISLDVYPSILLGEKTATAPTSTLFEIKNIGDKSWIIKNLFEGVYYPRILNFLVPLGVVLAFTTNRKTALFLVGFSLSFLLLYFSYYVVLERYLLPCALPLIYFASVCIYSAYWLITNKLKIKRSNIRYLISFIIVLMLFLSFLPYLQKIQKSPMEFMSQGTDINELYYPEQEYISLINEKFGEECYLTMQEPILLSGTHLKGIKTSFILSDNQIANNIIQHTDCLLFFEDLFCTNYYTAGNICGEGLSSLEKCEIKRLETVSQCKQMHEKFNLSPVLEYNFIVDPEIQERYNQESNTVSFTIYRVGIK